MDIFPSDVSLATRALLALTALGAGFIDAIAGGGGLLSLPALLAAGLPAPMALGTNKGQSVFGSAAALVRYWRAGLVDRTLVRVTFPLALVGSLVGARLVLLLRPEVLKPVILALLVGVAAFMAFRRAPHPEAAPRRTPAQARRVAAGIALGLGIYDGFFGPGVGTFLIVLFTGLLGRTLQRASADAKVVNFASNLAAVVLFSLRGMVRWDVALPMAAAQLLGGTLGAHLAVKGGDKVVRPVVLLVVLALVGKLAQEVWAS